MAQTKRKRQTKHRGNAAGMVEARGRTGRKPTAAEKGSKTSTQMSSRERRLAKYDRPPSWRSAFYKALAAAVVMVLLVLVLNHKNYASAYVLFPVVLLIYVPLSYYTDMWMYRRRQKSKGNTRAKGGR